MRGAVSDGVLFSGEKYPKAAGKRGPAKAQRSWFGGERSRSGMNELCHLWRSERYGACGDDVRKGPVRAKRARFPLVPPFRDACGGGKIQLPAEFETSCLPVRCPVCRSPSARAALPAQTCKSLQFNHLSQCRTEFLRRIPICARAGPPPSAETTDRPALLTVRARRCITAVSSSPGPPDGP